MVVSIGKCANAGYYTDAVGGGRESYYLDAVTAGEPPGRWSGRLAEQVGLVGEVAPEDMHRVFSTFTAPDGTLLGRAAPHYRSVEERLEEALKAEPDALPERIEAVRSQIEATHRQACLGWDLTASVPKSVTVAHTAVHRAELAAIRSGDPESAAAYARARTGIEEAIRDANDAAIEYASTLTTARAGWHGAHGETARWETAPDLVVASFFQHTSRAIQPQLHIHNVVLNRAGCADGQIRAIDGVDLLAQRAAVGAVFDLDLAVRLRALGFEVAMRPDGMARELTAVDQDVCELFSERRRVINAALAPALEASEERLGRALTDLELDRLRRELTLTTRAGKSHDGESIDERHARWQADLRGRLGRSLDPIARRVLAEISARADTAETLAPTWSPSAVIEEAVAALAQQRPTWRRSDLAEELARRLPTVDGIPPGQVGPLLNELAEAAIRGDTVEQVAGLGGRPVPDGLAGEADRPTDARYAAAGTLAAEDALRRAAVERGGHYLDPEEVEGFLAQFHPGISADQAAAVVGLAGSDARLAVLIGPAGTGKSYTAGAFAGAWGQLSGGGRVVGLTTSQTAAQVLACDGLPVTANLAAFARAQDRLTQGRAMPGDERLRLGPLDVVLVDEASMVTTADLHTVRDAADAAGARIVLTGDPRQLGAVGAGGVMGLLGGDRAETYTLADVRRFDAPWEAEASLRLRDGDLSALDEYDRHGRIVDAPDLDAAVASAARAVVADRLEQRTVLAVADTNALAARVSVRVRDTLIGLGHVQAGPVVELGLDQVTAGVGDVIEFRDLDYRLGVLNRGRATITAITDDGGLTTALPNGSTVTLPPRYVNESVSLGYCTTIHGAQGATVDAAHLVTGGGGDAASLYVGMSRGRSRNTAHVALTPDRPAGQPQARPATTGDPDTAAQEQAAPTGRAVLSEVLTRAGRDDAATVTAEADDARRGSAATLGAAYEDGVRQVCRARMERHLDTLTVDGVLTAEDRARLCADQGSEHLARLLRAVEQSGRDPQLVLRSVIDGRRGFADAGSVAQTISARITGPTVIDTPDPDTAGSTPAGIPAEHAAYLDALRADLDQRRRELGATTAQQAPDWAVQAWGAPPVEDPVARLEWEHQAGTVALHREATGWDDNSRALGPAAGLSATERRASWWAAQRALGGERLSDEVALTNGQLRVRISAWEREQTWAPPHADTARRTAELDAETARQDTLLAAAGQHQATGQDQTAGPDTPAVGEVAQHEARQVEAVGAARALEQVAKTRAAWAAATAPTRAAAERAAEEAARRGLSIGDEPDRRSAEDYLTHQHHTQRADEANRALLAEHELRDPLAEEARDLFDVDDRSPSTDHTAAAPSAGGAKAQLPQRLTATQLLGAVTEASAAGAVIADRISHDTHAPDDALDTSDETARVEEDHAHAAAHDDAGHAGAGHSAGHDDTAGHDDADATDHA